MTNKEYYASLSLHTHANKPIIERGYCDDLYRGAYGWSGLNDSDIWSSLIGAAGRFCERFASDLLIDYESYIRLLPELVGNRIEHTWLFGFREYGVDGNGFVESRLEHSRYGRQEYRQLWALRLEYDTDGEYDEFVLTLERIVL